MKDITVQVETIDMSIGIPNGTTVVSVIDLIASAGIVIGLEDNLIEI